MTWSAAIASIGERLRRRFGDAVRVEHIEVFCQRTFDFPEVLAAIEAGSPLPMVTVDAQIISQGGKLLGRILGQAIEARVRKERQP
jgi:hypothetical protein